MAGISATTLLLVLAGYLLGSIPFGLILAKLFGGKDVREHGSGNIGATNVSRVVGPLAGILTLLLDAAKGAVAVCLAGTIHRRCGKRHDPCGSGEHCWATVFRCG